MPVIAPYVCPHCKVDNMTFRSVGGYGSNSLSNTFISLFQCQKCEAGIVVEFKQHPGFELWWHGKLPATTAKVEIMGIWPEIRLPTAPQHTPSNVGKFYVQGQKALDREDFDAAGTMFRKSLDVGLKILHPAGKGVLAKRIDALPFEIGITPAMREWAHVIRDDGNDAAHEEEPFSEQQAKILQAFTETFLIYAFTMRGMIEKRRQETEDSDRGSENEL